MTFNVLLVGNSGVGKTSFIKRIMDQEISEYHIPTYDVTITDKVIKYNLNFIDIPGNIEHDYGVYYRIADVTIIMGDLTNAKSIRDMYKWYNSFLEFNEESLLLIVANKVRDDEEENEEDELGYKLHHINVKTGKGIREFINKMISLLDGLV